MNIFKMSMLYLSLIIFTQHASSADLYWPIITSTAVESNPSGTSGMLYNKKYYGSVVKMSVSEASLDSPYSGARSWTLGTVEVGKSSDYYWTMLADFYLEGVPSWFPRGGYPAGTTIRQISDSLSPHLGERFGITQGATSDAKFVCASISLGANSLSQSQSGKANSREEAESAMLAYESIYNNPVINNCITAPPENDWCSVGSDTITFDFGNLTVSNASLGVSKTKNINVKCSGNVRYMLISPSSEGMSLNNGMLATVTANNSPLGTQFTGVAGENIVPLTVSLTGKPNSAGAFYGSTILYVSYP